MLVGWYWQETTEVMRQRPGPVSLCPSRIWYGLNRAGTWTAAVKGGRITACQPARTWGFRQCKYYVKIEFLSYREHGTDQLKDQLVSARKIVAIRCKNHKKYINTLWGKRLIFFNVNSGGWYYSCQWALNLVFENWLSVMSFNCQPSNSIFTDPFFFLNLCIMNWKNLKIKTFWSSHSIEKELIIWG